MSDVPRQAPSHVSRLRRSWPERRDGPPPLAESPPLRVAVTGHRPGELFGDTDRPAWSWVRDELRLLLRSFRGGRWCEAISGLGPGVDQVFAEVALGMGCPLAAYIPFEGYEKVWPEQTQARYRTLLARAARRSVQPARCQAPIVARNAAMVRDCDVLVAVWDGAPGGGVDECVQGALRVGRPVVWVEPRRRTTMLVAG
jgi:uncharacterized phage-like protein YoqJ